MKIWYKAVCDKCGEATDVMVSNPSCTNHYLGDKDKQIQAWLSKHYNCELRLIWNDFDHDKLYEDGYERTDRDGINVYVKKQKFTDPNNRTIGLLEGT